MKIISHRGAAGLAAENTVAGIKIAARYNVEYIEVDVQATKDGQLVLLHDESVRTDSGEQLKVRDISLKKLSETSTKRKFPTLQEGFRAAGEIPLLIDCKGENWADPLAKILKDFKGPRPIVACADSRQLVAFSQAKPDIECFLSELTNPFGTLQAAKSLKLSGICMLYSIYNPLVYFLAKRAKLKMTMFTVNKPAYVWFLHFFYPEVLITTDFPNKFAPKNENKK